MAKDYNRLAKEVIELVGGEENVVQLTHCMTRLRFQLKDDSKADLDKLAKTEGVLKALVSAGQTQVVIGTDVPKAYDAILSAYNVKAGGETEADEEETSRDVVAESKKKNKKNVFGDKFVEYVSAIFMPFMGAFMGAGLLKGFLVLATTLSWLSKDTTTYTILYAAADSVFYFLPIFLGYTAGKKFGAQPFITMAIAAALCYPNFTALKGAETAVTFMGIPVVMISYTSSVLPIIVAAFLQAKFEKFMNKILPEVLRGIFVPLLDMLLIFPLTILVVGPVTDLVGQAIASVLQAGLNTVPALAGFAFAALWPVMIIFGVHWGVVPIVMNNYAVLGYDYILPLTVGTNFGIAAAVFAVFLRSKKQSTKELAGTSALSAFIGGVTEPAIYGILLGKKKLFAALCVANGLGGAICGIMHVTRDVQISVNALTLPAIWAVYGPWAFVAIGISLVAGFIVGLVTFKDED